MAIQYILFFDMKFEKKTLALENSKQVNNTHKTFLFIYLFMSFGSKTIYFY